MPGNVPWSGLSRTRSATSTSRTSAMVTSTSTASAWRPASIPDRAGLETPILSARSSWDTPALARAARIRAPSPRRYAALSSTATDVYHSVYTGHQ